MTVAKEIRTVLAGNPNCGKSTLFNILTGARQTIGNFPGVTVDRYEGVVRYQGYKIKFIDLPGLYSLSSISDEEKAAADYLNHEKNDIIINIVDAANLERHLYLTLLLKDLKRPMIVVLNMIDVAHRQGMKIDTSALSDELGLPVITTVGNRGIGRDLLLNEIIKIADHSERKASDENLFSTSHNDLGISTVSPCAHNKKQTTHFSNTPLQSSKDTPLDTPIDTTLAIPMGDSCCEPGCTTCPCRGGCGKCQSGMTEKITLDVALYQKINRICFHVLRKRAVSDSNYSDRIDRYVANRYLGIPLFLVAMFLVFQLTFTLGQYPMDWIENGFGAVSNWINLNWTEDRFLFLKSLLVEGIIGGVGGVLVFLPNIILLFLAISILEDSGYLARTALLCDRWMCKVGLHGRSIVPMLIGFGCTVPALLATKMLQNRHERLATMFVLPLFSCGARFPIYALIIPAFFPIQWRGPVLWLIYLIGIGLAIFIAKIMSLFYKKEEDIPFIIELPPYHFPAFRTVGTRTLERAWQYVKKAGTVILCLSVILWFLTNYPGLPQEKKKIFETQRNILIDTVHNTELRESGLADIDRQEAQARLMESYSGSLGHLMEPVLRPMGFDWKIGTALVGALAAKEVFIAQLGIVYAAELPEQEVSNTVPDSSKTSHNNDVIDNCNNRSKDINNIIVDKCKNKEKGSSSLTDILTVNYTPLTGFCVMLFCLIASPCMATFSMIAKESNSWKCAVFQWFFLTGLAWLLTMATFQIGSVWFKSS